MLFFPGGHCSAASDCGWSLYTSDGHGVSFSRPGYGKTDVGRLNAAEFVPAVAECCEELGIDETAGAVGVSFGGMQALRAAWSLPDLVPRVVLHSCAPSTRVYPDTRREACSARWLSPRHCRTSHGRRWRVWSIAAPSHLFWLGPTQAEAQAAVSAFMASNP